MSHEARDIVRLYNLLRELVPESVTEEQLLKTLQYTIHTLQFNKLDSPLECSRCGKCCTTSGHITLSEHELDHIKAYLKEHGVNKRLHVTRDMETVMFNGIPCPLYDKAAMGCIAYPVRPQVCRDFPREYIRRRARNAEWPLVSFCHAADQLVIQQTLRNLEHPQDAHDFLVNQLTQ